MGKKRGPIYETPEFLSADPEIVRFAEQYLAIRGTTPRTREAYQRDLEHFGAFLKARADGTSLDEKPPPPYPALAGAQYADILAYQTHLARSRRYAPRSMRRKIATLRTFYKYLRHSGRGGRRPDARHGILLTGRNDTRDRSRLLVRPLRYCARGSPHGPRPGEGKADQGCSRAQVQLSAD